MIAVREDSPLRNAEDHEVSILSVSRTSGLVSRASLGPWGLSALNFKRSESGLYSFARSHGLPWTEAEAADKRATSRLARVLLNRRTETSRFRHLARGQLR